MKKITILKYRVEPDRYSQSSKQSYGHEIRSRQKYYEDIEYVCRSCGRKDIYSAFEQKKAYENRKDYICCTRVLCQKCWRNKRNLLKLAHEMEKQYCLNKQVHLNSEKFLREWLHVLCEYKKYSYRFNHQRIRFIERHLEKFT
mgnify:CR=1 FL=1